MMPPWSLLAVSLLLAAPAAKEVAPARPAPAAMPAEPVALAESLLQQAESAYEKVPGYTTLFHKQERIANRLRKVDIIHLKFQKPFKIYMGWIESPDKGMEVIYKDGENDNKMKAHVGGFLNTFVPTVNIDIHDNLAMRNNRHLITETGIGVFLQRYRADFEKAKSRQEMQILLHGAEKSCGRKAYLVEARMPKKPDNGYYCYRSLVWFDAENKLPIEMEFYDHTDTLIEKYSYRDLKLNPKLTAYDFDPNNPQYKF